MAGFVVAEIANVASALGHGPFDAAGHNLTVLQLFLASALTASLVIAALVTDTVTQTGRFERQRSVADALQETVLPLRLPSPPGMQLAARYVPSSPDAAIHVGGDWYDAFALADGATAFVVGDIAGHDLDAAVVMGQLRNGLRSLLLELRDPVAVVAALDRQLASADEDHLASLIIAVLRGEELTWVNAGHPPLLHIPAQGRARYLEQSPAPMIGVGDGRYVLCHGRLEAGDAVLGFTDGLVEHPEWSLDDGFAHLRQIVDGCGTSDLEALCEAVLADGLGGRTRRDDTCLLVARRD
jgi:serine phosphatase RsbU (regulator of sigma subunit)